MRARTILQWWKVAFWCLTLALPTFVASKKAGWFVSFLGLIYLAVAITLSTVDLWHMDRRSIINVGYSFHSWTPVIFPELVR